MSFPRIVYAIVHNKTKRIYIGSSEQVSSRINNHICSLRRGKHPVELMQSDFNEYGEDYSFYQLDTEPTIYEKDREMYWMNFFRTKDPNFGYNYKDNCSYIQISSFPRLVVKGYKKPTDD